jgi:hypothetical protein
MKTRPSKVVRASHIGDSWAMLDSAVPTSRSTRSTNAMDQTAARRVTAPNRTNTAT